jgi:hypothetical protein
VGSWDGSAAGCRGATCAGTRRGHGMAWHQHGGRIPRCCDTPWLSARVRLLLLHVRPPSAHHSADRTLSSSATRQTLFPNAEYPLTLRPSPVPCSMYRDYSRTRLVASVYCTVLPRAVRYYGSRRHMVWDRPRSAEIARAWREADGNCTRAGHGRSAASRVRGGLGWWRAVPWGRGHVQDFVCTY